MRPEFNGCFEMTLRGHPCRIYGYVEPADHDVGIMAPYFCVDEIHQDIGQEDGGRLWAAGEIEELTGTELAEIDTAFWAQDFEPDWEQALAPEDLTAQPRRARIGWPAPVVRAWRWLGGLMARGGRDADT